MSIEKETGPTPKDGGHLFRDFAVFHARCRFCGIEVGTRTDRPRENHGLCPKNLGGAAYREWRLRKIERAQDDLENLRMRARADGIIP